MQPVLKDLFTGANGTALAAHTPNIGGPWTSVGAGFVIQGNKLTGSDASAEATTPVAGKIATIDFDLDYNGMDAGSTFLISLEDADADPKLELTIDGGGPMYPVAVHDTDDIYGNWEIGVLTGTHHFRMILAPGYVEFQMDGICIYRTRRYWPLANPFTLLRIKLDVAAGTYPLIDNLLVQA